MSTINGRARGQTYPCASLDEALRELRRPPAPAAVKFKLQAVSRDGDSAQVACYVDARLVLDRLDLVCGQNWRASFDTGPEVLAPVAKAKEGERILYVRCRLTVFGVTREDVGEGDTPKAAFSDALKRAAVHFGIGRALYAMASPWLEKGPGAGQLRTTRRGKLRIDARTEQHLRRGYGLWLEAKGRALFGEPLDHGDEAGAPGFEEKLKSGSGEEEGQPAAGAEDRAAQPDGPAPEFATEGEKVVEAEPAPESGDDSGKQPQVEPTECAGETATPLSGPATIQARLTAVSDGTPGPAPASALERKAIEHWRSVGRYKPETVEALSALICGQRMLDRLTREQVHKLALTLEIAVRGKVAQRDLASSLTRLAKREDRERAAKDLRERLVAKANEAQLTPPARERKAA
jgi:hypothetical protein